MSSMRGEVGLLQSRLDELASALQGVDILKFANELCKFGIIEKQMRDIVTNNIDHRVELKLRMKYLLQLICDQVREKKASFDAVLTMLSSFDKEIYFLFQQYSGCELDSDKEEARVTDKILTVQDIPSLVEALVSIAHKWEEIGLAVGIPPNVREDIGNSRSSSVIKLEKILNAWITGGYKRPITLTTLKKVLAQPVVGASAVADKLSLEDPLPVLKRPRIDPSENECSSILYQSVEAVVSYGMSTLLEIQVTSSKHMSYQWTKNGKPLSDNTSYQGTSSSILLVRHSNMASRHIEGQYVCEVESIGRSREILVTIEYPESIQHLLCRYSLLREVPKDSWPQVKIESYVDLALIHTKESDNLKEFDYSVRGDMDDILYKKEYTHYQNCFGKYESRTLVVVEGRPGVGKTTLAHKVTRDWSTGENIFVGADLVFLVSLRLLKVNKTNSIFELLGFDCTKCDKDMIKDFESQKGLKCCFVLDGLDEYQSYNSNEINFVYDLIIKKVSNAMVIVFSRPVGNKKLIKCKAEADRRIEILGFKSDQISHYIETYFQQDRQKLQKLMKYLEEHINVLHMCYLPVHVAMICHIHSQHEDSNILNTETQIYERFAMLTIIRKLRRECDSELSNQPTCFQDLNGENKMVLMKICKLAFDMCVDQRQVFESSSKDIVLTDESDSDGPSLGLVTVDSTCKLYNYCDIYAFLHLTFQEYLAAYHIFSQTSGQQLSIIDQHKDNEAMLVVWKFYCGMMGQRSLMFHEQVQLIFRSNHADTLYRIHCAFESHQSAVCDAVIDRKEQQSFLSFQNKIFTSSDYNALRLQEKGVKQLIETTRNNRLQQVNTFVFYFSDPTLEQLQCVKFLLSAMKSLDVLDLYITTLLSNALAKAARNDTLPHLECIKTTVHQDLDECDTNYWLCSTFNSIPVAAHHYIKGAYLDSIINSYENTLKYVLSSSILVKYDESLKQYFANFSNLELERNLNLAVFAHCSTFCFVNCSINDYKITTLSESLNNHNSVEKLTFDFNKICKGAAALVSRCTKLKHLSIRCNSIDDEGAKFLAGAVCECPDLVQLDLEYNCFGDEGAIAIASAVSHLNVQLYLWNASITGKGITSVLSHVSSAGIASPQICDFKDVTTQDLYCFTRAIKCCTSITAIKLYLGRLSEEGIELIRNFKNLEQLYVRRDYFTEGEISPLLVRFILLKSFTNLQILDMSGNGIGAMGAAALDGLKSCTDLHTLYIRNNSIGRDYAVLLSNYLMSCTNLQTLDISNNGIGSEGAAYLAIGLKSHTNFQTLYISNNKIGPEGAAFIIRRFKSYTNLQVLDISDNAIGAEDVVLLAIECYKYCTNLQTLDISNNKTVLNEVEFQVISNVNSFMPILDGSYNSISLEGAALLYGGINSCPNLQTLDISNNSICLEGAAELARGLMSCINLQTLDVSNNSIDSDGAAFLADGLTFCTNLQTLDISNNSIDSDGAAFLADGLKFCTNLQTLNISNNRIDSEGAAFLADGLTNLQTLNISNNSIGSDDAALLADGLRVTNF